MGKTVSNRLISEEVCPEQAIFLKKEYSITGYTRKEMVNNKENSLRWAGVREGLVYKWNKKISPVRRACDAELT